MKCLICPGNLSLEEKGEDTFENYTLKKRDGQRKQF